MICSNCGAGITGNQKFCGYCGAKILISNNANSGSPNEGSAINIVLNVVFTILSSISIVSIFMRLYGIKTFSESYFSIFQFIKLIIRNSDDESDLFGIIMDSDSDELTIFMIIFGIIIAVGLLFTIAALIRLVINIINMFANMVNYNPKSWENIIKTNRNFAIGNYAFFLALLWMDLGISIIINNILDESHFYYVLRINNWHVLIQLYIAIINVIARECSKM